MTPARQIEEPVLPPSLVHQLENERVRFSMACNCFVVRSADSDVVRLTSGEHARVPINPIRLYRGNPDDVSGRTRFYDLESPEIDAETGLTDAEIVAYVRNWMVKHPGALNNVHLQLKEHGETDPIEPFKGYDHMDVVGILSVLRATGAEYSLKGLLKYEVEVRPAMVDRDGIPMEPRDEVIDALEELAQERALTEIVNADMGVEGL